MTMDVKIQQESITFDFKFESASFKVNQYQQEVLFLL